MILMTDRGHVERLPEGKLPKLLWAVRRDVLLKPVRNAVLKAQLSLLHKEENGKGYDALHGGIDPAGRKIGKRKGRSACN